jgi:hypothetical protein
MSWADVWNWIGRFGTVLGITVALVIPVTRWALRKKRESRVVGIDKEMARMSILFNEPKRFGFVVVNNAFLVLTCLSIGLMTNGFAAFSPAVHAVIDLGFGSLAYGSCVGTFHLLYCLRDYDAYMARLRLKREKLVAKLSVPK